jgi:hypothetical protein
MNSSTITQAKLKELFTYDNSIGRFRWNMLTPRCTKAGKIAGATLASGHRHIQLNHKFYLEHRLVWLYHYGEFPEFSIDHIDGVRDNNRLENLREAAPSENSANMKLTSRNATGVKGISFDKRSDSYEAAIMSDGARIRKVFKISKYPSKEDALRIATDWVQSVRASNHKEFARA